MRKEWNSIDFLPNPGPDARGYGACYKDGKIIYARLNNNEDLHNKDLEYGQKNHTIVERQISAQIGDRMALGITKDFEELEQWVLDNTTGTIVHEGDYWFFEYSSEAVAFKLRWL